MIPSRRLVALAALLSAAAVFVGPVGAVDPAPASAWYYRPQQGGSVPLAPPESAGVPAGRLNIAYGGGVATSRSVIEAKIGEATQGTLVIRLDTTRSVAAELATVVACPAGPGWEPAEAAPWTSQPGFSCSPAVPVTIDLAGGTLTVTLDRLIPTAIDGAVQVLLTPAGDQQTPSPAPTPGSPGPGFSLITAERTTAISVRVPPNPTPDASGDVRPGEGAVSAPPRESSFDSTPSAPAPGGLFLPGVPVEPQIPAAAGPDNTEQLTALQPARPATGVRRIVPAASRRSTPRWPLPLLVFISTLAIGVPTNTIRRRNELVRDQIDAADADVPALEARALSVVFGGVRAVQNVSFSVPQGQILGLIGPNGAGKTTILDAITGLVPSEGEVLLTGVDVTGLDTSSRATVGLGRSFQDGRLFPSLTVTETIAVAFEQSGSRVGPLSGMVAFGPSSRNERQIGVRVEELIDLMGLDAYRDKFLSELSTGSRRIVDLACMIAHGSRVLMLDEPSSGIAQRETEALGPVLLRLRERLGCTIILIEHDMPLITSVADRLIALEVGEIIADGTPTEVVNNDRVIEAYLGTDRATVERSGTRSQVGTSA